ncbi:hypothetical protein [Mesorhizobium onobrychidis]|uniref:Uncharacterized protein n=1 Tax=Mesorhizobium onobrychidis TaxID=2775404 RepID=A0ABY5R9C3_9HYPH|nr:hypothetical protein [Mesorhizobium onobrychidis]UVC19406.1 hypothetical protein IHQ72_35715 [Mesorhizobium onobrychidis]
MITRLRILKAAAFRKSTTAPASVADRARRYRCSFARRLSRTPPQGIAKRSLPHSLPVDHLDGNGLEFDIDDSYTFSTHSPIELAGPLRRLHVFVSEALPGIIVIGLHHPLESR